jgi:hypothetical protein
VCLTIRDPRPRSAESLLSSSFVCWMCIAGIDWYSSDCALEHRTSVSAKLRPNVVHSSLAQCGPVYCVPCCVVSCCFYTHAVRGQQTTGSVISLHIRTSACLVAVNVQLLSRCFVSHIRTSACLVAVNVQLLSRCFVSRPVRRRQTIAAVAQLGGPPAHCRRRNVPLEKVIALRYHRKRALSGIRAIVQRKRRVYWHHVVVFTLHSEHRSSRWDAPSLQSRCISSRVAPHLRTRRRNEQSGTVPVSAVQQGCSNPTTPAVPARRGTAQSTQCVGMSIPHDVTSEHFNVACRCLKIKRAAQESSSKD